MLLLLLSTLSALAQTVTVDTRGPYATGYAHTITIAATAVTTSTEITVTRGPRCGDIVAVGWSLDNGTGTTLRPRLGTESAFTSDGFRQVLYADVAAAEAREVGSAPFCGVLYLRPNVDAGSDNEITIELLVSDGVKR